MPKKNKNFSNKDLSIHFFVDGFSFCTQSKIEFIPTLKTSHNFNKILKEYLEYYVKKSSDFVSIILFQNPSIFVPISFFDESLSENYLGFFNKPKDYEIVSYDLLEESNQVNIYSFPKSIRIAIEESKINFELTHYNTLLYKKILELNSSNEFDYQLFIHFQSKAMDIFLLEKGNLIFNNRFLVTNEDEFLYYLFFIVEQFDIDTKDLELIFLGKIPYFKTYYQAVKQYHSHIKFVEKESSHNTDLSTHHAPYLAKNFS